MTTGHFLLFWSPDHADSEEDAFMPLKIISMMTTNMLLLSDPFGEWGNLHRGKGQKWSNGARAHNEHGRDGHDDADCHVLIIHIPTNL